MKGLCVSMISILMILSTSLVSKASINDKPVIILCAFGTSTEALSTFEYIEKLIKEQYKGYEIRWAYTSQIVIKKLKEKGVVLQTLSDVYEDLRRTGKTNVIVQSLHIVPGQEFHREIVMLPAKGLNVKYGYPLLTDDSDFEKLFKALEPYFAPENDSVTILCGHGNDNNPEFNASLIKMDEYLRNKRKNTFLATVEGQPGIDKPFNDAKSSGLSKVHFVPLMLVAGDHIMNDVMGDEDDSWKNQLAPMKATAEKGMGYNDAVIRIFMDHIDRALEQF